MICVSLKFDFPMTAPDSKRSTASCLFVREAYVASYDRPMEQFIDVDALLKIDESCASESKIVKRPAAATSAVLSATADRVRP